MNGKMPVNRPARKPYCLIGFSAYYCLICIVSQIPGDSIARLGFDIWDKAMHTAEYLPLGLLGAMSLARRPFCRKPLTVVIAGTTLVLALGALDEFHQWFVPGRFADVFDALADGIGGFIGIALGAIADAAWKKRLSIRAE
jgi:VanZ family protein